MFELPKLDYAFDALEPYIDTQTMQIHYQLHHGGYVKNLNQALEGVVAERVDLTDLDGVLANLEKLPEGIRTRVRNNAGGHWNHSLWWRTLGRNKELSGSGKLREVLEKKWGGMDNFRNKFCDEALARFGSGWVFLVVDGDEVKIESYANQDNPLMNNLGRAILGLDVWEHAYYLKYQNRRNEYVDAWWNVVNWEVVEEEFKEIRAKRE